MANLKGDANANESKNPANAGTIGQPQVEVGPDCQVIDGKVGRPLDVGGVWREDARHRQVIGLAKRPIAQPGDLYCKVTNDEGCHESVDNRSVGFLVYPPIRD